jgi:hypothetical protein
MGALALGPLALHVNGLAADRLADLREAASVLVPDYFQEPSSKLMVELFFGEESTSWTKSERAWTARFAEGVSLHAVTRVLASISANFAGIQGALAFHAVAIEDPDSAATVIVGPELSGKTSALLRLMKSRTPLATNVCYLSCNEATLLAGTRTITRRNFEQSFALERSTEIALPQRNVKVRRLLHLMPTVTSLMVVPSRDPFLLFNAASIIPGWATLMSPRSAFQWLPSERELIERGLAAHRLLDSIEQFQVTGAADEVADWIAGT